MKKVKIEMTLCDRLVMHAEGFGDAVEQRFKDLIKAVFKKNEGDIHFKREFKEMEVDENLGSALKNMDKAVLNALISGPWRFSSAVAEVYRDFSTLKTLVS